MYKCKPQRAPGKAYAIMTASVGAALLLSYIGNQMHILTAAIQLISLLLIVVGLYALIRFGMTEMIYFVSDSQFGVTKVTGNKSKELCCLSLSTAVAVCDANEYKQKYAKTVSHRYDYHQNMFSTTYFYVCEFNGKYAAVRFEPNEQFLSILKANVDAAVSRRNESSEPENHMFD